MIKKIEKYYILLGNWLILCENRIFGFEIVEKKVKLWLVEVRGEGRE